MNALNGDPGARAPSHRRSGTKDPLPARSEAPGDEGTRGTLLSKVASCISVMSKHASKLNLFIFF